MASNYKSTIQTREDAIAYLGDKDERPLPYSQNLRIEADKKNGDIMVKLHGHTIVYWDKEGNKTFPYHGMYVNTPTTKRHRSAFGGPWADTYKVD